jgi:hypothetical protein
MLSDSSQLSVPNCSIAQHSEKVKKKSPNSLAFDQEDIMIVWPLVKSRSPSESYECRHHSDFRQVIEKLVPRLI